jgi:hypothetical protein
LTAGPILHQTPTNRNGQDAIQLKKIDNAASASLSIDMREKAKSDSFPSKKSDGAQVAKIPSSTGR